MSAHAAADRASRPPPGETAVLHSAMGPLQDPAPQHLTRDDGGGRTTNTPPFVADYSEWSAEDYFQTYYSDAVLPDEQAVLAYQIDVLSAASTRFGRGLEFGCGPTLHRAIAASKYADRIDMADWLEDNLTAAR